MDWYDHYTILFCKRQPNNMNFSDLDFLCDAPVELFSLLCKQISNYGVGFTYSGKDYDDNGVLYWLGTNKGMDAYLNPAKRGLVHLNCEVNKARDDYDVDDITEFVSRRVGCYQVPSAYPNDVRLIVDLSPAEIFVSVDAYTLAAYPRMMRNWELLGSNDKVNWVVLKKHVDDETINLLRQSATWTVTENRGKYQYFCIKRTGPVSVRQYEWTAASGFELYGTVYQK
jgi:hypothetical protein